MTGSVENDDEIERDMEAKFKEFEDVIRANSNSARNDEKSTQVTTAQKASKLPEQSNTNATIASKPVPDFEKLKKESIEQQLIVREFFTARAASKLLGAEKKKKKQEEEEDPAERVTIIDEHNIDDTGEFDQNLIFRIKETDEEIARVFPTVDSKSQTKIRRMIFYEKLVKRLIRELKI